MTDQLTPQQIRDAEFTRSRRGFDEVTTRGFLARAADALSALIRERDELRAQVDELNKYAAKHPTDAETIGAVLMTAHRAGEELLARAAEEAAELRERTEAEREELLARTQANADELLAEAGAQLESVRREDEDLRRSIDVYRQELAVFLRASLAQLEEVDSFGPKPVRPPELDGELLSRLPSE